MDINGNLSLDDAEVREVLKVHAYTVGATAAYSDQFPGEVANSVPGDAGFDDSGKPKKYILMAAATSGVASARADIQITGTPSPSLIFGLAEPAAASWAALGTSARMGKSTVSVSSYALSSATALADMQIAYGIDTNADGLLQASEVIGGIPYDLRVASPQLIAASVAFLVAKDTSWKAQIGAPIAANWLYSFLNDVGVAGATNTPSTITTADTRYNHHVGALFTGQTAPANNAIFGPTSVVARIVYGDLDFRTTIADGINAPAVAALLGTSGEWRHFDLGFDELPINFASGDLHYAIGHATLESVHISYFAKVQGSYLLIDPTVTAVLSDLYDFDLDAGGASVPAAIVEAGYAGTGTPGHVFLEQIHLAGELSQLLLNIG